MIAAGEQLEIELPMNWHHSALAIGMLLAASCGEPPSSQHVVGRYEMNEGRASDALLIRSDGKWVHEYRYPTEPAVVDSGAWTFQVVDGEPAVEFLDFTVRSRRETFPQSPIRRGTWVAFIERGFDRRVRFSVDDDLGWMYVQK
jgi:hypothetical protein